jgi:hypothetical protein
MLASMPIIIWQVAGPDIIHYHRAIFGRGIEMFGNELTVNQRSNAITQPFKIVRVYPVFGGSCQTVLDRICMDVNTQGKQMAVALGWLCLKLPLK